MTTLTNRATPRQALVLRMVEGACRNAMHVHPGQPLDERMCRSIAKRAAGTLVSQWDSVLAAPAVRQAGDGHRISISAAGADSTSAGKRGAAQAPSRTPIASGIRP